MGGPGSGRRKGSHGKQTPLTKGKISAGVKGIKKGTKEYGLEIKKAKRSAEKRRQERLEKSGGYIIRGR